MRNTGRPFAGLLGSTAAAAGSGAARAEEPSITIGITLPLTGSGAEDAFNTLHGAVQAIEEANARGGPTATQCRSRRWTTAP